MGETKGSWVKKKGGGRERKRENWFCIVGIEIFVRMSEIEMKLSGSSSPGYRRCPGIWRGLGNPAWTGNPAVTSDGLEDPAGTGDPAGLSSHRD